MLHLFQGKRKRKKNRKARLVFYALERRQPQFALCLSDPSVSLWCGSHPTASHPTAPAQYRSVNRPDDVQYRTKFLNTFIRNTCPWQQNTIHKMCSALPRSLPKSLIPMIQTDTMTLTDVFRDLGESVQKRSAHKPNTNALMGNIRNWIISWKWHSTCRYHEEGHEYTRSYRTVSHRTVGATK